MTKKGYLAKVWNKVSAFTMMLAIVLSGAVSFTSCSEDEGEGETVDVAEKNIVGNWRCIFEEKDGRQKMFYFQFNADNSGIKMNISVKDGEVNGRARRITWNLEGDKLWFENGEYLIVKSLTTQTLVLDDEEDPEMTFVKCPASELENYMHLMENDMD